MELATFFKLPRLPKDEVLFVSVAAFVFLFVYLLPLGVFEAKIDVQDVGLKVTLFRKEEFIPFEELSRCYSVFLFPFQTVFIITKRGFPLTILIAADSREGRRRSLLQDGHLLGSFLNLRDGYSSRGKSSQR